MEGAKQSLSWSTAIDKLGEFSRMFTAVVIGLILLLAVVQVLLRYCTTLPLLGLKSWLLFNALDVLYGRCLYFYDRTHISCGILEVITENEWLIGLKNVIGRHCRMCCRAFNCILGIWP